MEASCFEHLTLLSVRIRGRFFIGKILNAWSENNVCGIYRTAISFVVVAIVPTSVGIRRTEVQFLAGTASCPASMVATRKKAILKETMPGATRSLASSHDEYSGFNSTKS